MNSTNCSASVNCLFKIVRLQSTLLLHCEYFLSFIINLVADSVAPAGTFHLVKLCLLLSLVMEGDQSNLDLESTTLLSTKNLNNLHILVESQHILIFQRMMQLATTYSSSPTIHQSSAELFGSVHNINNLVCIHGKFQLRFKRDSFCYLWIVKHVSVERCDLWAFNNFLPFFILRIVSKFRF